MLERKKTQNLNFSGCLGMVLISTPYNEFLMQQWRSNVIFEYRIVGQSALFRDASSKMESMPLKLKTW